MSIPAPYVVNGELLTALGLAGRTVRSLTIHIQQNEYPTVSIVEYVRDDGGKLASTFSKYELIPKDGPAGSPREPQT